MLLSDPLFGFLAFGCAMVANRLLAERALKRLTMEEKARLLDSFSGHRVYSMIAMLTVGLLYFIVVKAYPASYAMVTWTFCGLLLLTSIGSTIVSYKKLKRVSTPEHYIANFLIRCVVYYAGLGVLLFVIVTRYLPQ